MRHLFILLACLCVANAAAAGPLGDRDGWAVLPTEKSYPGLIEAVKSAAGEAGLGVVTEAGPTEVARLRGIDIPGNRVIGLFNNDFAVRILALSTAAMIEAPVRMYVTENPDGTATLAYKRPSHVFMSYADEGGPELAAVAAEIDARFAEVARLATR